MACQESFTLYKKTEIEGYLDKVNTGITAIWLSGKTRTWCELYGTTLYLFKDSKSRGLKKSRGSEGSAGSAGSVGSQQVDLTQVHMVRKVNNDKSSAQFEILTKMKQHIFSASSVTECDNWIRHLQAAMTMKDQKSAPEQRRSEFFVSDYETIKVLPNDKTDTAPGVNADDANTAEPAYSEMDFTMPPDQSSSQLSGPATTTAAAASSHNGESEEESAYCTVELRRSSSSQPAVPQVQKTGDSDLQGSPTPTPSTQERPVIEEDGQGYVKVEMRKKSFTELPLPPRKSEKKETESTNEDYYTYATVKKPATCTPPENKNGKPDKALADGTPEVSSDEEDVLIGTSQRDPDPIPPLPHPLEPADLEPLAALREFLSNNRKLCRPSFSERAVTDDPVADVKRLLEELCL